MDGTDKTKERNVAKSAVEFKLNKRAWNQSLRCNNDDLLAIVEDKQSQLRRN